MLAQYWPDQKSPILILRSDEGAYKEHLTRLPKGSVVNLGLPVHGPVASLKTPRALAHVIDDYETDVLFTFLSLPAVAALRPLRPRVKIIASIQNPPGATAQGGSRGNEVRHSIMRLATDLAASYVDGLVLPSLGLLARFSSRPFIRRALRQGTVSHRGIPNPLDPEILRIPLPERDKRGPLRVVTAGRLVPQKRFDIFIEAIGVLRRTRDIRASIYGEGPMRTQLLDRIRSLGLQEYVAIEQFQHNLASLYQSGDVFALTSDFEGFGNVLIEALGCGLPVVSTDVPYGPAEILDRGRYGLLVPPGDPKAIASAIELALPGGGEHDRLASVARWRAERYAAPRVAEEYFAFAFQLYESRPPSQ